MLPTRHLSGFEDYRYFTYPHLNGFISRDGADSAIVVGQVDPAAAQTTLLEIDLATSTERSLGTFQHRHDEKNIFVWWDVDVAGTTLVSATNAGVYLVDLTAAVPVPELIFTPPPRRGISAVVSLHPASDRCLVSHYPFGLLYGPTTLLEIDLATKETREVLTSETMLAHFQYCEADPAWIGFSNQSRLTHNYGPAHRAWVHHPEHAPYGRLLWDQQTPTGPVSATHEVWAFHDVSCVLVAPHDAAAPWNRRTGTAGLYQVWADGRPARLIRESTAYNHCSIDRTGTWAVVDCGPYEVATATTEDVDSGRVSLSSGHGRIELIPMAGGEPIQVSDVGFGSVHPRHPHPNFSPTGRTLAWTDTNPDTDRTRVGLADLTNLENLR